MPFSSPKNALSYLRSAFLCSGSDMSSLSSFMTMMAYVVHSFQHALHAGYLSAAGSSDGASIGLPHFRQVLPLMCVRILRASHYYTLKERLFHVRAAAGASRALDPGAAGQAHVL